jgi:hypothetical protein
LKGFGKWGRGLRMLFGGFGAFMKNRVSPDILAMYLETLCQSSIIQMELSDDFLSMKHDPVCWNEDSD